jgi:uncharacterized protein
MTFYLDTNVLIYFVERNPTFGARASARIFAIQAASDPILLSDLTRMECLVMPFRTGDTKLEASYNAFFNLQGVQVVAITRAVCEEAARIRAHFPFKQMDSLHLAAAVAHGADVFVTNDTRLNAFTGLTIEVL